MMPALVSNTTATKFKSKRRIDAAKSPTRKQYSEVGRLLTRQAFAIDLNDSNKIQNVLRRMSAT